VTVAQRSEDETRHSARPYQPAHDDVAVDDRPHQSAPARVIPRALTIRKNILLAGILAVSTRAIAQAVEYVWVQIPISFAFNNLQVF